ncbi:hypothetical protein BD560DRAFT_429374 [Blakeslea trispora]|nr:hypothetical protein BD560DRAFT_429374 [Blakeslea trispora]
MFNCTLLAQNAKHEMTKRNCLHWNKHNQVRCTHSTTSKSSSQNPSIMPNKLNIVNLVEKIESTLIEDGAQETTTNAPEQYVCNSCVILTYCRKFHFYVYIRLTLV